MKNLIKYFPFVISHLWYFSREKLCDHRKDNKDDKYVQVGYVFVFFEVYR